MHAGFFAIDVRAQCSSQNIANERIHYLSLNPATKACNFIKKDTLALVFSREFCEISKNTFFTTPLDDCFC